MFNDTITVYNKYTDAAGTERWQRTILAGVFWNATKGAVTRRTGVSSADAVQLIIPFIVAASRPAHKPPKAWAGLSAKTGYWTLQSGDIVILGAITQEITRTTKELAGYDDMLTITSVDTKGFGGNMSHWEVSGR